VIGSSGWRSALPRSSDRCDHLHDRLGSHRLPAGTARSHAASPRRPPSSARAASREALLSLRGGHTVRLHGTGGCATLGFSCTSSPCSPTRLRHNHRGGRGGGRRGRRSHRKAAHRRTPGPSLGRSHRRRHLTLASAGFVVLSLPVASSPVLYSLEQSWLPWRSARRATSSPLWCDATSA